MKNNFNYFKIFKLFLILLIWGMGEGNVQSDVGRTPPQNYRLNEQSLLQLRTDLLFYMITPEDKNRRKPYRDSNNRAIEIDLAQLALDLDRKYNPEAGWYRTDKELNTITDERLDIYEKNVDDSSKANSLRGSVKRTRAYYESLEHFPAWGKDFKTLFYSISNSREAARSFELFPTSNNLYDISGNRTSPPDPIQHLKNLELAIALLLDQPLEKKTVQYKNLLMAMDHVWKNISDTQKNEFVTAFCREHNTAGYAAQMVSEGVGALRNESIFFQSEQDLPTFLTDERCLVSYRLTRRVVAATPHRETPSHGGGPASIPRQETAEVCQPPQAAGPQLPQAHAVTEELAFDGADVFISQWPHHTRVVSQILRSDFSSIVSPDKTISQIMTEVKRVCQYPSEGNFGNCLTSFFHPAERCRRLHERLCSADPYFREFIGLEPVQRSPDPSPEPSGPGLWDQFKRGWSNLFAGDDDPKWQRFGKTIARRHGYTGD